MAENPIKPTIDLDCDGAQHGFLRLPYSHDESAWGSIMIPITVIKNGEGPTALITGGNHGDEYEGPVAIQDLALNLRPEEINGRVILLPALNFPAFRAGKRTSPIDGGNMNRIFPGRADGTVSEKIADYVQHALLPISDIVLDFHSGGKTLEFLPFAACHRLEDKKQEARSIAAMNAFGAPYSVIMLEMDQKGMLDTAAEEMGKTFVSTELGGGGTLTARTIAIAKKGACNILCHAGILDAKPDPSPSILLDMPDDDCFVTADKDGLLEPLIDLGETLSKGDVVARVWPLDRTGHQPQILKARRAGFLVGRHFPGLVKTGDCLAVIAQKTA